MFGNPARLFKNTVVTYFQNPKMLFAIFVLIQKQRCHLEDGLKIVYHSEDRIFFICRWLKKSFKEAENTFRTMISVYK